jgi:uncharacterized membrane protein YjgN (DUF898 family)
MSDSPPAPAPFTRPADEFALSFDGKTWDYFRVRMVAFLLTVLTCGIFLPWAEMRCQRFIYEHTRLGTTALEYRARPFEVFKVQLLTALAPSAWLAAIPRLHALGFVMLVVWALAAPWFALYAARAEARRVWCAGRQLEVSARYADMLSALLLPYGLCFMLVPFGMLRPHAFDSWATRLMFVTIFVTLLPASLHASVRLTNVVYGSASLGSLRCVSELRVRDALWMLANSLLGSVSLGLLTPWVELRTYRRQLSRLRVVAEPELTTELDLDRTWA